MRKEFVVGKSGGKYNITYTVEITSGEGITVYGTNL